MANDKLQDLIETLKKQGIESGEKAGQELVETARKQAADIINKAKEEAASIVAKARDESDKEMKRLQSSLEIAASQFVSNLKAAIENNLLTIPLKDELTGELSNPDLMKQLLTRFVEVFASGEPSEEIFLLVPQGTQDEIRQHAIELMARYYQKGEKTGDLVMELDAQDIRFGFQVSRNSGAVRMDFSDDAFLSIFLRYLSPRFKGLFKNVINSAQDKK